MRVTTPWLMALIAVSCVGLTQEEKVIRKEPIIGKLKQDTADQDKWTSWGNCSVPCGGGIQNRTKGCTSQPVNPATCKVETQSCNTQSCPTWGNWTDWTVCTKECGSGKQERQRDCLGGVTGDIGCIGNKTEEQCCNAQPCPLWDEWGEWGNCSVPCGHGEQIRERKCINGSIGDAGCEGESTGRRECNTQSCAKWDVWMGWTHCSVQCGIGNETRIRKCNDGAVGDPGCEGDESESKECIMQPCAKWDQWGDWGNCSVEQGNSERKRICLNGDAGDPGCIGDETEAKQCRRDLPIGWADWEEWSRCTVTCGGGKMERKRKCKGGSEGDDGCRAGDGVETNNCNGHNCPRWNEWMQWGNCTVPCGGGRRERDRECIDGKIGQNGCTDGEDKGYEECNIESCAKWDEWSEWSKCGVSCGGGTQLRMRKCTGGKLGSDGCPSGGEIEDQGCAKQICPTWSSWGEWSNCSVDCGNGTQERDRECVNGELGQKGCSDGVTNETRPCFTNCTEWGDWSECSKHCGGGEKERSRICNHDSDEGDECNNGTMKQIEDCNTRKCAHWTKWGNWGRCILKGNGKGIKSRKRKCKGGKPGHHGCKGHKRQTKKCSSKWGKWGKCSERCGGGTRERYRKCRYDSDEGDECNDGEMKQTEDCNTFECADWTSWGRWSKCLLKENGKGVRRRKRKCKGGKQGERECEGRKKQTKKCSSKWGKWGKCSKQCGGGTKKRYRSCRAEKHSKKCKNGRLVQKRACNQQSCMSDWISCTFEGGNCGWVNTHHKNDWEVIKERNEKSAMHLSAMSGIVGEEHYCIESPRRKVSKPTDWCLSMSTRLTAPSDVSLAADVVYVDGDAEDFDQILFVDEDCKEDWIERRISFKADYDFRIKLTAYITGPCSEAEIDNIKITKGCCSNLIGLY